MSLKLLGCASAVLLAVGLTAAGCTGSDDSTDGPTEKASAEEISAGARAEIDAASVCASHFDDVRHSQLSTVRVVRHLGPALVSPPPGPLDEYPDEEPIALCLVPHGTGSYDAVAVILSDDATFVRWTQNLDDNFYWPI